MKKILPALVLGSLLIGLIVPVAVFAQPETLPDTCSVTTAKIKAAGTCVAALPDPCNPETDTNCGICCMLNTIYVATNWLFMILMLVAVIMIVVGGFLFITASGDPEKAGKAKTYIVYALIGIAIALFAKILPAIIKFIMGV